MKAFTPIILIAISIATYYMYISPKYADVQKLVAEKARYVDTLKKAGELKTKRDAILADYSAVPPEDIDRLKKIIPDKFDSVLMVRHLDTVASKYGMVIKGVKIAEQKAETREQAVAPQSEQYKTISVTFSVKGTYDQFLKFLKDLESGLYLMDVSKLSMKEDIKNASITSFDYGVEIRTYSLH